MEEDEFEDEELVIVPVAVDLDAIASVVMEYASDQAAASAKLLSAMSLFWAGQFKKNMLDRELHEEITRDIESLPTAEE